MADEEKGAGNNEDAKTKENDDDVVPEPGCCFHYGECLVNVIKHIYKGIVYVIMSICDGLGYCWYPTKERCCEICECCGKRIE